MRIPTEGIRPTSGGLPEKTLGIVEPELAPLPGTFSLMASERDWVIAAGGGNQAHNPLKFAVNPDSNGDFRLWADVATGRQYFAVQTPDGHFVSAVNGGGLSEDALSSTAGHVTGTGWELFTLGEMAVPAGFDYRFPPISIRTLRDFYLSHVSAAEGSFRTAAVQPERPEAFGIGRSGDFGSGGTYYIQQLPQFVQFPYSTWGPLLAVADGADGREYGVYLQGSSSEVPWRLLKQSNGTYAFLTAGGYVLTANQGGTPTKGFSTTKTASEIDNFETFTLEPVRGGASYIRTYSGSYVTVVTVTITNGTAQVVDTVTTPNKDTNAWFFWVAQF